MEAVAIKRKLIDISPVVFERLQAKAIRQGVSLKKYIENMLEADSADMDSVAPEGVSSPGIISLIGIARNGATVDWEDDRLNYLLSK